MDESYPTAGIAGSMYSRHKSAGERILDRHEAGAHEGSPTPGITRLRPGIVGQGVAGSALLRYGTPGLVPGRAIGLLPLLPLDRRLVIPMIHADDVADATVRVLRRRATGAFNLAAPLPLTPAVIASALGARTFHVPARALRAAVHGSWLARLQPLDPGWVDLAMNVPMLDTRRAAEELDWRPAHSAEEVLRETVSGMRTSASAPTPVLRRRTVAGNLRTRITQGSVTNRREPQSVAS